MPNKKRYDQTQTEKHREKQRKMKGEDIGALITCVIMAMIMYAMYTAAVALKGSFR